MQQNHSKTHFPPKSNEIEIEIEKEKERASAPDRKPPRGHAARRHGAEPGGERGACGERGAARLPWQRAVDGECGCRGGADSGPGERAAGERQTVGVLQQRHAHRLVCKMGK